MNKEILLLHVNIINPHQWRNQATVQTWLFETIDLIRQYTNRNIIVRPHPRCPIPGIQFEFKNIKIQNPQHVQGTYDDFDFDCTNAYAVVNWSVILQHRQ